MAPAAAVSAAAPAGAGETRRLAGEVARVLDECRASLAVHPRKLRELAALRSSSPAAAGRFLPAFCAALTPLFDLAKRSAGAERVARFAAAFASASSAEAGCGGGDGFLEGFLRFLLAGSAATHRPARLRSCQIIFEVNQGNSCNILFPFAFVSTGHWRSLYNFGCYVNVVFNSAIVFCNFAKF
jgi:condensin complex subunit 3